MIVAALQHDIVWEDPTANFERLAPMISSAADSGARLVVLSEMYSTGFSLNADRIAEPLDGPSVTFLAEQAAHHHVWICASVPIRLDDGLARNMAVVAAPDGTLSTAAKIHPFTFDREDEVFVPGDTALTVRIDDLRVSVLVCYDLRFAPAFWRLAADTDCYIVPANWPEVRRHHWSSLLVARAIENQAWVVGVNRAGRNIKDVPYSGDSAIVSPLGETMASASGGEAVLLADVTADAVRDTRERFPFLADRREDLGE